MGGGGGSCLSNEAQERPVSSQQGETKPASPGKRAANISVNAGTKMTKIYIIFYTTYGHIYKLAEKIKEGVDAVEGVEGILYQVPETLPEDVLAKMHAPPKPDVPIISAADLPQADGFIFGFPTRFGNAAAQFRSFFDSTGGLWMSGALVGKPATMFTSNGTQGGGQEVTIFSSLPPLIHQGMIYVPPGYTYGPKFFDMNEVRGASPWGAGTFAGPDGSRQPSDLELDIARHQGEYFAKVAKKLAAP